MQIQHQQVLFKMCYNSNQHSVTLEEKTRSMIWKDHKLRSHSFDIQSTSYISHKIQLLIQHKEVLTRKVLKYIKRCKFQLKIETMQNINNAVVYKLQELKHEVNPQVDGEICGKELMIISGYFFLRTERHEYLFLYNKLSQ